MRSHADARGGRPVSARRMWALALALVLSTAACSPAGPADGAASPAPPQEETAGLSVVATTTVLGDVTREVVGECAAVAALLPVGADPHGFEPSAQQVEQLQQADLVVTNGADLLENLEAALAEAEAAGVPTFVAVDHVETLAFVGDAGHDHADEADAHDEDTNGGASEDHGHASAEGATDPHIWMDPLRMSDVAAALGEALDGLGCDGAVERARAYGAELDALVERMETTLAVVPETARTLVTNHEAFQYFADRFDFEIAGTVVPDVSTGAEPSAQDLERLAEIVREEQVAAVFAETTQPVRLAETVSSEVGGDIEVVQLYTGSLGEADSATGTYIGMMEENAQRIADALGA